MKYRAINRTCSFPQLFVAVFAVCLTLQFNLITPCLILPPASLGLHGPSVRRYLPLVETTYLPRPLFLSCRALSVINRSAQTSLRAPLPSRSLNVGLINDYQPALFTVEILKVLFNSTITPPVVSSALLFTAPWHMPCCGSSDTNAFVVACSMTAFEYTVAKQIRVDDPLGCSDG